MANLKNGKIPPFTECPFIEICEFKKQGACHHLGKEHPKEFSCASARGFKMLKKSRLSGLNQKE
jgi:hypothetical protein